MKQFVLLSIVCFSSLFVIAQDPCENLRYFISLTNNYDSGMEVTDQIISKGINFYELDICEDWQSIYFWATSSNKVIKVGSSSSHSYSSIDLKNNPLPYNHIYIFYENDVGGISYCQTLIDYKIKPESCDSEMITDEDIKYQIKDGIDGDFQPFEVSDNVYLCSDKDVYWIKAINSGSPRQNIDCSWKINDISITDEEELQLHTNNLDTTFYAQCSITNEIDETLYSKNFTIQVVQPPGFKNFKIKPAENCDRVGSVSFDIINPYDKLEPYYSIDGIRDGGTTNLTLGEHCVFIAYDLGNNKNCVRDTTFTIDLALNNNIEFTNLKATYCVGDILTINLTDSPENKNWFFNDIQMSGFEDPDEITYALSPYDAGNFQIKLQFYSCDNWVEYTNSTMVYPKPMPEIIPSHEGVMCNNEILELEVETIYNDYIWTVKHQTGETIFEDRKVSLPELDLGQNGYSVQVTDTNGCVSDVVKGSISVSEGVDIITPGDVVKEDELCVGTKVLYGNSKNLNFNSSDSNIPLFRYNSLSIVEWNSGGNFSDGSDCGKIETTVKEHKSPNGKIQPFGNIGYVFADSDHSANHLEYQWFYLDLSENAEAIHHIIENATERLIDCLNGNFNCLFEKQDNKVLGLEIYDNRNDCTNLIFYDIHNFFKDSMDEGLVDIPVTINELAHSNVFTLYPNLNKGSFYIEMNTTNAPTNQFELEIYNTVGELISLNELTTQNRQKIDVSSTKAGIYFATLKQAKQVIAQHKFIIH